MSRNKDTLYTCILQEKFIYLAQTNQSIKIVKLPYLLQHCY